MCVNNMYNTWKVLVSRVAANIYSSLQLESTTVCESPCGGLDEIPEHQGIQLVVLVSVTGWKYSTYSAWVRAVRRVAPPHVLWRSLISLNREVLTPETCRNCLCRKSQQSNKSGLESQLAPTHMKNHLTHFFTLLKAHHCLKQWVKSWVTDRKWLLNSLPKIKAKKEFQESTKLTVRQGKCI